MAVNLFFNERYWHMKAFYGVYRGFSPTDESAIGVGELEVTIDDEGLKVRFATGLGIQEETIPMVRFTPMTANEVAAEFKQGSTAPVGVVGFQDEDGVPKLLFLCGAPKDFALCIRLGEMSSILGPTLLFSPAQVAEGLFDKLLEAFKGGAEANIFPLLSQGGKA